MKCIEYGKENPYAILLLHGGGLSWWNYQDTAKVLEKDYHVIIPMLNGHANSDAPFTSIKKNAKEIIEYIDTHFGGTVLLIGGLSLGGQIALEILSTRKDICKYAIIESALVTPSKLLYSMIKPAFGGCYGLIKHKWFAKLQFQSLKIKPEFFERYYHDTCAISKKDMIAFLQANAVYTLNPSVKNNHAQVCVLVGEKENNTIKKSAKIIHQSLQNSNLQILPKLYHGEFSINHGKAYAEKIKQLINK